MENVADALKMAAAVLVFVSALSIGISSFSQARATADILIAYSDRETVTQFAQDTETTSRLVGAETIIPTIYRAYKENYRILFYDIDGKPIELYSKNEDGATVRVSCIDEEEDAMRDAWQEDNFIMALLYGTNGTYKKSDGSSMTFSEFKDELYKYNSKITLLNSSGIYDTILKGSIFEERYGVYYQDDTEITIDSNTDISDQSSDVQTSDANKTKKRVISYYKKYN